MINQCHDAGMTVETPRFRIVLRGYARAQVDEVVDHARRVLASPDAARHARLRERLPDARFDVVLRGYDRVEVDDYLRRVAEQLG